jgi:hypothetical protein
MQMPKVLPNIKTNCNMKKMTFLLFMTVFFIGNLQAADFAGGSGTETNPYQIANRQQLENLQKYVGSSYKGNYYVLTSDIDLAGSDWVPIGNKDYYFYGKFYGEGYKISNLTIGQNGTTYEYTGLFGCLGSGADIDNIYIASGNIKGGGQYTGSITGNADAIGGNIYVWNCTNNCNIQGGTTEKSTSYTGGIIGGGSSSLDGTLNIYRCINYGNILSGNALGSNEGVIYAGGITGGIIGLGASGGTNSMLRIRACINTGAITGNGALGSNTGGIVGVANSRSNYYGNVARINILECANTGDVTGGNVATANTGGLIGQAWARSYVYAGGSIGIAFLYVYDCYSNARIHAPGGNVGGLIGKTPDGGTREFVSCYAVGSITGNAEYAGGLVGYEESGFQYSVAALSAIQGRTAHRIRGYGRFGLSNDANANMTINGNTVSSLDGNSEEGTDKTPDELYRQDTYTAKGWNFSDGASYWTSRSDNTSFPYFQYQAPPVVAKTTGTTHGLLNLTAASDSVRIYRYNAGNGLQYFQTIKNPTGGDNVYWLHSPVNLNDTLVFFNFHQTDKQWAPSYPVYASVNINNTGINNPEGDASILISPNPVEDGFRISGLSSPAKLVLLTVSGKRILSQPVQNEEYVSITAIPAGVYIVEIATGEKTVQRKIIKKSR